MRHLPPSYLLKPGGGGGGQLGGSAGGLGGGGGGWLEGLGRGSPGGVPKVGGGLRATHYYHMHTSRVDVCLGGFGEAAGGCCEAWAADG